VQRDEVGLQGVERSQKLRDRAYVANRVDSAPQETERPKRYAGGVELVRHRPGPADENDYLMPAGLHAGGYIAHVN
jgi:hypothetical protein